MTLDESFAKWVATQDHAGLPWQTSREELFTIFYAGWHAHIEALRQTDLFPGTWDKDNLRPVSSTVECRTCNAETPVQPRAGAESVTAEDVYASYPRKVGKQAAIKAIKKAAAYLDKDRECGGGAMPWLLHCVQEYAQATARWPAADKQFIPFPATWFNRGSYDDNPAEWSRGQATSQFSKTY
jgi:hypothetical protein